MAWANQPRTSHGIDQPRRGAPNSSASKVRISKLKQQIMIWHIHERANINSKKSSLCFFAFLLYTFASLRRKQADLCNSWSHHFSKTQGDRQTCAIHETTTFLKHRVKSPLLGGNLIAVSPCLQYLLSILRNPSLSNHIFNLLRWGP